MVRYVTLFGWAHFRPKRKGSLFGRPGPGLDLGREGGSKLVFVNLESGGILFDLGTGWAGFQQKGKESLLGVRSLAWTSGSEAWPDPDLDNYIIGGGGGVILTLIPHY